MITDAESKANFQLEGGLFLGCWFTVYHTLSGVGVR